MNKLENEKGKHRLIVLPIQPQSSNDFNGIGLALHFLLGNTVAVNTYLKEFWFGWRVKKLFPQEKDLKVFTHGQTKSPNLKRLSQEQGIRFWLYGQVDDYKTTLSLYDGEEKGRPASAIISFSFDDDLIGFRSAFIHWLDGCGLPFSESQKKLALWPEKITWKGADIFGRALEAFYIYSAYGDPNERKIDLHPFKKVVAASPDSFMGQNLLGWVCYRNKRYQNAKEAFLRALLANPDSPGVMSGLMWCCVYTKDEEEALYWASRKAAVMDKDIETARQKTLNRLKKGQMKVTIRIFLFFAVGYSILVTAAFIWQRKMIYFPDREKPMESQIHAVGLQFWPNNSNAYNGFIASDPPAESKGTVIVFHGNAGGAWHRNYYVHALVPLGFNVVLAEYPGYGGRDGGPSENNFINDARTTIRLAHEAHGDPLYLWGESLGCGVAAAIAADPPVQVEGVVLVTPWDSLPDLAQSLYWYFPVRWLLRDKFDNVKNLQSFDKPVAVAIAAFDEIIPTKRSLGLYESLNMPKRLWRFEAAGHNNWPTDPTEEWWREVMQFVSSAKTQ